MLVSAGKGTACQLSDEGGRVLLANSQSSMLVMYEHASACYCKQPADFQFTGTAHSALSMVPQLYKAGYDILHPQRNADLQRLLLRVQQAEHNRQHGVEVVGHHLLAPRAAILRLHKGGLHLHQRLTRQQPC